MLSSIRGTMTKLNNTRRILLALAIVVSVYLISLSDKRVEEKIIENAPSLSVCNCLRDSGAESLNQSSKFHWCSVESDLRGSHQQIVAYSVFGDALSATIFKRYLGLMTNISSTIEKLYPGWIIRFYHDYTEKDKKAYQSLCDIYCRFPHVDLCSVPAMWDSADISTGPIDPVLLRGLNRRMYRFLVMLDPQVDIFISRDIDSFIYQREVDAVEQWLQSNFTFHLMRDHPHHSDLVLAGMWGAKLHQKRETINKLTRKALLAGQDQIKSQDQRTLASIFWPVVKLDVMAHDSYQCNGTSASRNSAVPSFPFPTRRNGRSFVGGVGNAVLPRPCPIACRPLDHQDWEYC